MNILVVNDDGINSEGVFVLAKCLSKEHNILVVAPDGNRSAFSHSLSIMKSLKLEQVFMDENIKSYSLSGTPADCVKFAHHVFADFKIDLVCAGINNGNNLGTDVIYSGTVSAGLEANALGMPAVAFSCTSHTACRFDTCGIIATKIIDKLKENLSCDFTYNVNIPNVDIRDIKGVKMTKLGVQIYTDAYEKQDDGSYLLTGHPIVHDKNDEDCDVEWNLKNYVTITPIRFDRTDYSTLKLFGKELDIL